MRFPTLFRIAIHHDYSRDGFCHGLELIPSANTKAMMEKSGMMLKMRDGKYEVLAEANEQNEIRFLPGGNFHFNFFLVLKNALFFNCTDLPLSSLDRFPTFSNLGKNEKSPLFLHASDTVTSEDLLEEISLNGNLTVAEEGKTIIKNEFGEIVYESEATPPSFPIDLSAEGNGKYFLEQNEKTVRSFYAYNASFGLTVRGAVDIWYHSQLPPAVNFMDADGKIATKEYEIHFASRKAYWNYLITGTSVSRYQSLAITDAKREIFFTGPQSSELFNGSKGLLFTSPEPLFIKEANDIAFQLRRNCTQDGNAGFPVIERLPIAQPDLLLQPEKGNEEGIYSEIIVYL